MLDGNITALKTITIINDLFHLMSQTEKIQLLHI